MGGIHGVGKGTLCKELSQNYKFIHLIASEVLKWEQLSDKKNKKVRNFSSTQERLLKGLSRILEPGKQYLLDGHFCLLNSNGIPDKIPEETFLKINPNAIIVKTCEVDEINKRLELRDNSKYSYSILKNMQDLEISYAKEIAHLLGIPIFITGEGDNESLQKFIRKYESTN